MAECTCDSDRLGGTPWVAPATRITELPPTAAPPQQIVFISHGHALTYILCGPDRTKLMGHEVVG